MEGSGSENVIAAKLINKGTGMEFTFLDFRIGKWSVHKYDFNISVDDCQCTTSYVNDHGQY